MFKRAIAKCTPEQQARQDKCRNFGCIACIRDGNVNLCGSDEIHHLTVSGRTISQDHTIALGQWHHRAICKNGFTSTQMERKFGPSLAKGSKTFHARYGTNDDLLKYQNELIGEGQ